MNNFDELKSSFVRELVEINSDAFKGHAFEEYFKCMNTNESPQNAKQLQIKVGGEYRRAKIAYEIIAKSVNPPIIQREIPSWYDDMSSSILSSIQKRLMESWSDIDTEIQTLAAVQTDLLEAKLGKAKREVDECLSVIDDLEKELENTKDEVERLNKEIQQQQKLMSKNSELKAIVEQYKDRHSEQIEVIKEKEQEIKELNNRLIDISLQKSQECKSYIENHDPDETFDDESDHDEDIYPENIGDIFND